ncbi:hypothetical protein IQ24_01171 [Paracoccus sulfuroxidans]|uniref:Uncharacterized protein n=1 Tax=Paracoccus sulfuroxidans TaxID=384678 RepID=A0A562NUL9_9RHOB|nr:hypothetical protein IQ24_01171 [Paracoccus sulfuroxidans]
MITGLPSSTLLDVVRHHGRQTARGARSTLVRWGSKARIQPLGAIFLRKAHPGGGLAFFALRRDKPGLPISREALLWLTPKAR